MSIYDSLQDFCEAVKAKSTPIVQGAPEDQLRAPFEDFMDDVAATLGWRIVCTGEPHLGQIGRPDYAVQLSQLLSGYVELKAPGTGANAGRFRGHNREQFKRFSVIPNLLYTDGNEWALYRDGKLEGKVVQISGDILADGKNAVSAQDAQRVENLLRNFLQWQPIIPTNRQGQIHLRKFAEMLAPLCRMLRQNVIDALEDSSSSLVQLAEDWRQLLFPNASDEQFADAYAQTVTFALLLGRSEGADPLTLTSAVQQLDAQHSLLSRALEVLTDRKARKEIEAPLDLLVRVIAAVPPAMFTNRQSPWLYFYEDFLAAYDPELRKDTGAYYTPPQVVHAQVRLIDELLTRRLNKPWGFADSDVVTLDPAAGTGTYLLGVIEHALQRVEDRQGPGAVPGKATDLAENLYGFELLVGPFAVAELRVSRALLDHKANLPADGPRLYLTDTLEDPNVEPLQAPLILEPIAEQHEKALKVKGEVPVIVCLGNPPYDRHEAATPDNKAETGGWVRWGEDGQGTDAILNDFIDPAVAAGHSLHVKNLYNLYVYFWRWALWKVFEHETSRGQGVVSFISASSYLDGDAFSGMREHMRRICDEIWIIDLGGEGRGTRREDNVFAIQTPVAIAIALRDDREDPDKPARVHYTRIEGSEREKLDALEAITDFKSLKWQACPDNWQAPFLPAGKGDYFAWPLLTDLMPWQHSGVQFKRTWPIGPDPELLKRRWRALLNAKDRAEALKETRDRKANRKYLKLFAEGRSESIESLPSDTPPPPLKRYAYRSFDRQWILADNRVGDYLRPVFWRTYSDQQMFLTSLFSQPLGEGPALTACAAIPDLDYFRGSYGAKATIPLYRTADASEANIAPGLLDLLGQTYGQPVTPEDFVAYVYGLLAQPAFTERFFEELKTKELRVPITKDAALFEDVRQIGARLLWLHTYGKRFVPAGKIPGRVPQGKAKCTKAIPTDREGYPESYEYNDTTRTLRVGKGEFKPVAPEVFDFEVSGLKVVQSWLDYRMKGGAGRKSSPLDDINPERWPSRFTEELLELLWVLEKTVAGFPERKQLLEAVVAGDCFTVDDVPSPPEHMRKKPKDKGKYTDRLI
jgi:hypothetical protein